jgi:hypothetical protein
LGEDTAFNIHVMNRARLVHVVQDRPYNYFDLPGSLSSDAYKPALLESFEAHYEARIRVHAWPAAGTEDCTVLRKSIAISYVEYILPYMLNNVRYLPLRERLDEIRRIRHSHVFRQCIPDYAGHSRYRGVRFLVKNFVRERYRSVVGGLWLADVLAWFRFAVIQATQWRR